MVKHKILCNQLGTLLDMRINLRKFTHILFFLVIIPGLSVLVVLVQNYLLKPFSGEWFFPYLESLGFIGAYAILFTLFDRYFWKLPYFRMLGIVGFPNLQGRWRGNIVSSFDNKKVKTFIEIRQTFLAIYVDMYCPQSQSTSLIADFVWADNNQLELHYEYRNEPEEGAEKTMNPHNGTAKLNYFEDKNTLKGSYYNANRFDRGNTGTLEFKFQSKKLLRRY